MTEMAKALSEEMEKNEKLQKQLTEKDKEIDYQKQARSIAENAVVECTKQIADLENKLSNVSYQLEGREVELNELQEENEDLRADVQNRLNVEVENIELKKQIEKMKCVQNCKYGGCDNNCHYENEVFILPKCTYCNNWQLKESAE